jgi:two-component system KDP operon response regulator KdpE
MATASQYFRPVVEHNPATPRTEKERLRILVIEDEQSVTDFFYGSLRSAGYALYPASTGGQALQRFQAARPDLILLELGLPDMDGKQVIHLLRKMTTTPIIVMSARQEEEEKIACLDTGADDYITKPFPTGELLARLRAALRRAFGIPRNEVFSAGELRVDFARREVFIGSEQIKLTATEYDLLKALASRAGTVVAHHQLIHEIWGTAQYGDAVHLLRVTMSNLRRKLRRGAAGFRAIATESGVGYRLRPADCKRSVQVT